MIIDDDRENADLMLHHLQACGFRVVIVKSAVAILKRVLTDAPSLIIIDLMSPQRIGLKVCRELQSNPTTQDVPIIMVTAKVDESDKIVALELGVDDFMHKPFNLHELNLRVERSLDRAAEKAEPLYHER